MGLYDFEGGSLDVNASGYPEQTSTGGYIDTGVSLFNNVADKWLQYQKIKTSHDLEYLNDPLMGRSIQGGVPSWVWLLGALGVAFVAYRAVR